MAQIKATSRQSAASAPMLEMFRRMVTIREFEDLLYRVYTTGVISGGTHLYQGQEAVAVGFAMAMQPDDYSTYTYRSHGHVLARGMDPGAAFGEILGRSSGCNRGKGGSMHLTDPDLRLMGCFAIVGAGLPIAVGLGRAAQLRREKSVSVTFFGDGATNEGAFHEALNLASIWKVPIVFVCENNLYGEYTRIDITTPVEDLAVRATGYAMPSAIVDGNDVVAVYRAAQDALMRAREGDGPTLIEAKTYRQGGHGRMDAAKYRPKEELDAWLARDPIVLLQQQIIDSGEASEAELQETRAAVAAEIQGAYDRALASPTPDLAEVTSDVYA